MSSPEYKRRTIHSLASHYTHCAISAQDINLEVLNIEEVAKGLRHDDQ